MPCSFLSGFGRTLTGTLRTHARSKAFLQQPHWLDLKHFPGSQNFTHGTLCVRVSRRHGVLVRRQTMALCCLAHHNGLSQLPRRIFRGTPTTTTRRPRCRDASFRDPCLHRQNQPRNSFIKICRLVGRPFLSTTGKLAATRYLISGGDWPTARSQGRPGMNIAIIAGDFGGRALSVQ
jgi:hypothetical protein